VSTAGTQRFSDDQAQRSGSSAPLLRVTDVAKAFGPTQAVRDASFELRAGEVLELVGENGCSKSTMVKILSGVHLPDAGEIELHGEAA
jgi:ABC-type sugar transport system ATPase subunit